VGVPLHHSNFEDFHYYASLSAAIVAVNFE
jgi:hypothetical protein